MFGEHPWTPLWHLNGPGSKTQFVVFFFFFWEDLRSPLAWKEREKSVGLHQSVVSSPPPLCSNTWKTDQPHTDITAHSGKMMRKTVRLGYTINKLGPHKMWSICLTLPQQAPLRERATSPEDQTLQFLTAESWTRPLFATKFVGYWEKEAEDRQGRI